MNAIFDAKPDPMGLEDLRVMLHDEAGRRWTRAARFVKRAIVGGDVLGVGDKAPMTVMPVADKAALFGRWLDERLMADVGDGWMSPHITAAAGRAQATIVGLGDYQSLGGLVSQTSYTEPKSQKVCCAATDAALAGIRDVVSRRASSAVAASLLPSHRRASRIAALVDQAMGEGLQSTRRLSEHALSMAYSQATLDALEGRGVTHVGTMVERHVLDAGPDDEPRNEHGEWTSSDRYLRTAYRTGGRTYVGQQGEWHGDLADRTGATRVRKDGSLVEAVKGFVDHTGRFYSAEDAAGSAAAIRYAEENDLLTNDGKDYLAKQGHEWLISEMLKPRVFAHDAFVPAAAGIMFITPDGQTLFLHRTDGEGWAFPGGMVHPPETLENGAAREAQEELGGHFATGQLDFASRNDDGPVDYTTFLHSTTEPFEPTLNHEHDDHVWADWQDPPEPLHPGVRDTLDRLTRLMEDYDPDEPRDERGEWMVEGGSVANRSMPSQSIILRAPHGGTGDFGPERIEVLINPKPRDVEQMGREIAESGGTMMRAVRDVNGNVYVWPAMQAIHADVEGAVSSATGTAIDFDESTEEEWPPKLEKYHLSVLRGAQEVAARATAPLKDFDPNEPRDETGKWTAFEFASPSTEEMTLPGAISRLTSAKETALVGAAYDINTAIGIEGSEQTAVVGAWKDGAEQAVMTRAPQASWDQLRLAAAMQGHLANQKAVLVFHEGVDDVPESQKAVLYSFPAAGHLVNIHKALLDDGLEFHTLQRTADGATVYVADTAHSAETKEAVAKAAARYGGTVDVREGRAEFIGTQSGGSDEEQRADARSIYEGIINGSKVSGAQAAWGRVRDRWSEALGSNAEYEKLLEQTRALEGMKAAVVDPVSSQIFTGKNHWEAMQKLSPESARRVEYEGVRGEGEGTRKWMFEGPHVGFKTADGRFVTREEVEKSMALKVDPRYGRTEGASSENVAYTRAALKSELRQFHGDALLDAARKNPQAKHPRTGKFAKAHIVARERHRRRTGQFGTQAAMEGLQRAAERAQSAFAGVEGEWDVLTAGDDKVCKRCQDISDNGPYPIARARSLIPAHPNCRCVFTPAEARATEDAFDFDPDEPRDPHGRWTGLQGSQGHYALISTRPVTAVGTGAEAKAAAAEATNVYKTIDLAAMKADPEKFADHMKLFADGRFYPGMRPDEVKGSPDTVAHNVVERLRANLDFLVGQQTPEFIKANKRWYDGAHKIADGIAKASGIDIASASGVVAALSPQTDWDRNVYLAKTVAGALTKQMDHGWDKDMEKTSAIWKDENADAVPLIRGKTLRELSQGKDQDAANALMGMWIRTYDEAHSDRHYRAINAEGGEGDFVRKEKGKGDPKIAMWGTVDAIGNAVAAYRSKGDANKLGEAMGDRHKVRSFYNNILDPDSPNGDVTVDTHAVGAAWLSPYTGKDVPVYHALSTNPKKADKPEGYVGSGASKVTGVKGTYGLYAQAYREAAKDLGLKPRELQSIAWVAKREMFAEDQTGVVMKRNIDAVWRDFHAGKLDLKAAQRQVMKVAKETKGR